MIAARYLVGSCHFRTGGTVETGVGANIDFVDGLEGELHDAVRNPVK
jgi:hypothetical protein